MRPTVHRPTRLSRRGTLTGALVLAVALALTGCSIGGSSGSSSQSSSSLSASGAAAQRSIFAQSAPGLRTVILPASSRARRIVVPPCSATSGGTSSTGSSIADLPDADTIVIRKSSGVRVLAVQPCPPGASAGAAGSSGQPTMSGGGATAGVTEPASVLVLPPTEGSPAAQSTGNSVRLPSGSPATTVVVPACTVGGTPAPNQTGSVVLNSVGGGGKTVTAPPCAVAGPPEGARIDTGTRTLVAPTTASAPAVLVPPCSATAQGQAQTGAAGTQLPGTNAISLPRGTGPRTLLIEPCSTSTEGSTGQHGASVLVLPAAHQAPAGNIASSVTLPNGSGAAMIVVPACAVTGQSGGSQSPSGQTVVIQPKRQKGTATAPPCTTSGRGAGVSSSGG